jgi:hypothetical protein
MDAIGSVRHDAAALCRFIDQVAARCTIAASPSYTGPSEEFFKYISALGEATKDHLMGFVASLDPTRVQTDTDAFYIEAQQIRNLRLSWFELHRLIKPALDADTLEIPNTLIDALTDRLRQIIGFTGARLAVIHTTALNYYQVTSGYIQQLASEIGGIVNNPPQFPHDLGIVAIPYSQSSSLFLNTALAHEMGHYAFGKRDQRTALHTPVVDALSKNKNIGQLNTKPGSLDIPLCIDTCIRWLEEIYCDLFALFLVGPCFSLSYIELFALSRVTRAILTGSKPSSVYSLLGFSDTHPAHALRLREHVAFMSRPAIGWWPEIQGSTSEHVSLMQDSIALPNTAFSLDPQFDSPVCRIALEVFLEVLPQVHSAIENTFVGVPTDVEIFHQQKVLIQKYLGYGVVPSRIVDGPNVWAPSAVALLNAVHLFYLDEFDILLERIEKSNPKCRASQCLVCRSLWTQRLEMWTTKALEDIKT